MRIKVITEIADYKYKVSFKIEEIQDIEILKISKISPIIIDFKPQLYNINNSSFSAPSPILSDVNNRLILKDTGNGKINFEDLYKICIIFDSKEEADKYSEIIIDKFNNEINRINSLEDVIINEKIYEVTSESGIRKIYQGAEKLLDTNSKEYKEIIEKNKEIWKTLAEH